MTPDSEYLEHILAEHAAATECGVLVDGPTAAERSRFASELENVGSVGTGVRPSGRPWSRRTWLVGTAAAVLALAVGLWALFGGPGQPNAPEGGQIARDDPPAKEEPKAEFLNGRGRLVPVGNDTRYTLVDAVRGLVRLDAGELFVELPPDEGLQADIETSAGTVTALGTSFYTQYQEPPEPSRNSFLTVAVLGGFVEVHNKHGRAMAGAGEVVLAEESSLPKRYAGSPPLGIATPPERGWWQFGNVLGMLHRREVQAELKLTEKQKAKLDKPTGDDWREIGLIFRDVYSVPSKERPKKAAEFRTLREKKIAEVLDADQQRRMGEILLQQEGCSALANPELAELLKLSQDQRRQVGAVTKEFAQARRSVFSGGNRDWKEMGKKMDELRKKESEKLATLLTDAQREQWQGLLGKPFELERRAGDGRDWWDSGNWWWDSGNGIDWRDADSWRGRWGSGGWRERWGPPKKQDPKR